MRLFLIITSLTFFLSCSKVNKEAVDQNVKSSITEYFKQPESLSPKEYVNWVQHIDNRINKEKTIDDLTFSVQYKPYEYIVCMEEKKAALESNLVKEKVKAFSDMQYYDLKIELENGQGELLKHEINSPAEYERRLKYAAFEMQHDIKLVSGGDTLPCALYHFERAYDVAPFSKFLLGFPLDKSKSSDKTLIFHDKIFNKGILKFNFDNNDLINIPKLKTS